MKKSTIRRLLVLCLCLTLVTVSLIGGTLAKYTSTVSGTDTATVAKFVFGVKDKDQTAFGSNVTIDLFDDITPAGTSTVKANLIAPGCSGNFSVAIDCSGSEVDIDLTSTVTVTNSSNIPLKFYIGDTAPSADTSYTIASTDLATQLQTAIAGELLHDGTQTKTVNVYWKWVDGQGDPADTTIGAYGTATAPTYTLAISVTATQAMDARSNNG